MRDYFDFSNYDKEHPLYDPKNKAVVGLFKDECGSSVMDEFVGLRSKCYAFTTNDGKSSKKCKGVKKAVVKDDLKMSIASFRNVLQTRSTMEQSFTVIRSVNHVLATESIRKTALSAYDSKRFILGCGIKTRAFGHYKNNQ